MKENISNEKQNEQSCKTDVKCRFFAQYFGLQVYHIGNVTMPFFFNENSFPITEKGHLKLKPLSKITDEDAEKLQYTLVNVVGLDGLIRQNSIELVKEVVSNYEQIDCLFMLPSSFADLARELGYAIDWNNYKVSKQIELGWVRLV